MVDVAKSYDKRPVSVMAVPPVSARSIYPEPFASRMQGRVKRKLGDYFGLENFGINMTSLAPGAISALKHFHLRQDEFIYILKGHPTLHWGEQQFELAPGACFGFRKGVPSGHQLENRTDTEVTYLEIGDRTPDDHVEYPQDDLVARGDDRGHWQFFHKDGRPY